MEWHVCLMLIMHYHDQIEYVEKLPSKNHQIIAFNSGIELILVPFIKFQTMKLMRIIAKKCTVFFLVFECINNGMENESVVYSIGCF